MHIFNCTTAARTFIHFQCKWLDPPFWKHFLYFLISILIVKSHLSDLFKLWVKISQVNLGAHFTKQLKGFTCYQRTWQIFPWNYPSSPTHLGCCSERSRRPGSPQSGPHTSCPFRRWQPKWGKSKSTDISHSLSCPGLLHQSAFVMTGSQTLKVFLVISCCTDWYKTL